MKAEEPQTNGHISERDAQMRSIGSDSLTAYPDFPSNLLIELSNACNHKCIFCSNSKMTRPKKAISRSFTRQLLKDAFELGTREVGFYTTGEPFIHKDLALFVKEAKAIGYTYTYITTNGALATPKRSQPVLEAGIDSIKFSVNAASATTYARIHGSDDFDTVVENIEYISEYRRKERPSLKLSLSYVTTDENRHEVPLSHQIFSTLVDDLHVVEAGPQGGYMNENFDGLSDLEAAMVIKPPCHNLFARGHITAEGYLTMCCVDYQNYLAVADLKKESLKSAWYAPKFVDLRKRHLEAKEHGLQSLAGTLCYNCMSCSNTPAPKPLSPDYATTFSMVPTETQDALVQLRSNNSI